MHSDGNGKKRPSAEGEKSSDDNGKMRADIIKRQNIFSDRFIRIEKVDLEIDTFAGKKIAITRYALDRPLVVSVLLYLTDVEKIVLVEQFRYSSLRTKSGWMTEVVAGLVDQGEDPAVAARRELFEETGYKVDAVSRIMQYYPSVGLSNQLIIHYFAKATSLAKQEDGGGLEEEGEDIKVHLFSKDQAEKLLAQGELEDAKTIIALQYFLRNA